MIALEGRFDSSGDTFLISTWIGSISIFSIHSATSYSGTYMNQFFENELISHSNSNNNHNQNQSQNQNQQQTIIAFPNFCNMFLIPYTIQQPHSKHRYEAFELQVLQNKVLDSSIDNTKIVALLEKKLPNDENLEERIFECQKEEDIYKEACKDNLAYMLLENDNEPPSDPSNYGNESEVYSEASVVYNDREDDESNENLSLVRDSYDEGSFLEDDEDINDQSLSGSDNSKYNLRSRRRLKQKKIQRYGNSSNRTGTPGARPRGRPRLNREPGNIGNRSNNIYNTRGRNTRNSGNSGNVDNTRNTRNTDNSLRVRAITTNHSRYHTRNRTNTNQEDDVDTDEEYQKITMIKEKSKSRIKLRTDKQKNISLEIEKKNNVKKHSIIEKLMDNCKDIEDICYICKVCNQGHLLGPFYTQDYISFNHFENEEGNKNIIDEYHHYYFHYNCLLKYNDFLIYDNNEIDLTSTIKEILRQKILCWRCE